MEEDEEGRGWKGTSRRKKREENGGRGGEGRRMKEGEAWKNKQEIVEGKEEEHDGLLRIHN